MNNTDFEFIAQMIAGSNLKDDQRRIIAIEFARALKFKHSQFDFRGFISACCLKEARATLKELK